MNALKFVYNPITGYLEYVNIPLTKQQIIGSILLCRNEEVSETYPQMSILFDDTSILYADDNFTNA